MVKTAKIGFIDWLQTGVIRAARVHFVFCGLYVVYIIASDATRLITPESVLSRWYSLGALLVITAGVWQAARTNNTSRNFYRMFIYILIVADLFFAAFNVYTQRGMASRSVLLFLIPIILSSLLLSRVATFTTATLATAAYSLMCVKYFVDFFNEGYKAELYIEAGFYIGCFYITAMLLNILIRFNTADK